MSKSTFITTQADLETNSMVEVGYEMPSLDAARRQLSWLKAYPYAPKTPVQFSIQEFDAENNYVRTYWDE